MRGKQHPASRMENNLKHWNSAPSVWWENSTYGPNAGYTGFEASDAGGPFNRSDLSMRHVKLLFAAACLWTNCVGICQPTNLLEFIPAMIDLKEEHLHD